MRRCFVLRCGERGTKRGKRAFGHARPGARGDEEPETIGPIRRIALRRTESNDRVSTLTKSRAIRVRESNNLYESNIWLIKRCRSPHSFIEYAHFKPVSPHLLSKCSAQHSFAVTRPLRVAAIARNGRVTARPFSTPVQQRERSQRF